MTQVAITQVDISQTAARSFRSQRALALAALTIAAWTGVIMRFGLVRGFPAWAQNYVAVRHAHSHLMYFGWVTLGMMALIWMAMPRLTRRALPRAVGWQMAATAGAALLSFPAFWANGYGLTTVGPAQLPLGSMAAALNVLTWYAFIALYVRATWSTRERALPLRLWEGAVALLALSTVGVIGLALLVARGTGAMALYQLFLHLFLDLFGVGWFTLALLGVLWTQFDAQTRSPRALPAGALALALIPTFLLGMSPALVGPALFWVAALANVAAAGMLARHWVALWRGGTALSALERFALICLGVHLAVAMVLLWPGLWRWAGGTQLRVFYLHNFLLGWVSSGLLGVLLRVAPVPQRALTRAVTLLWIGGVSIMLAALLGLGLASVLPGAALGLLRLAAWSSVLPATAASLAWGAVLLPARVVPGHPARDRGAETEMGAGYSAG